MLQQEPLSDRIRKFFYNEEVPFGLALCRMLLPMVLMGMVLPRWIVCRELYSADGATGQLSVGYGWGEMLPEFSGTVVAGLYAVLLFSMVTLSIGWCTRVSAIITFVLFTYFSMLDCVSTMTKYTVIVTHILFILSVSQCGHLVCRCVAEESPGRNFDPTQPEFDYPKSAAWPRRLLQLHIAFVYFGAAMTKIHTPSYFSGDQLQYWMLTHLNFKHPLGELLSLYPILLVVFGYITVVWEITFIFCSWKSAWRNIVLPIGILFHFMTTLTLGLLMFPMVCYCTYFAFVDDDDMRQSSAWIRRQTRRFSVLKSIRQKLDEWQTRIGRRPEWQSPARFAYAMAVPLVAVFGIQIEYEWDLFGERRAEGRYQLVAIDPEFARLMLAPVSPQRDIDKFFAVDMGTFLVGELLADRRTSFTQGEKMIAQCNLIPPHEDMVVECKIRNSDNRMIDRLVAIATRELYRVNITFPIPDNLPPGEYIMTVETAGRHVMQKKFQVRAKDSRVASR